MKPRSRRLKLRRPDRCAVCDVALPAATVAFWDAEAKTVTCLQCLERGGVAVGEAAVDVEPVLDRGVPGASARRRYERLHTAREQRARAKLGRLGGLYLAMTNDPQSTVAWAQGGRGERLLGEHLEKIHDEQVVVVLHDRRIPGTRANIDHIAVTRSGAIWAIDAKNYRGKVQRIDRGGWFSTDLRLYVGRRECTKLVQGMAKQVDAIRVALTSSSTGRVDVRAPGHSHSLCRERVAARVRALSYRQLPCVVREPPRRVSAGGSRSRSVKPGPPAITSAPTVTTGARATRFGRTPMLVRRSDGQR